MVEGELPGSGRTAARTEKTRFRVDWETKQPSGRQKGQRNADRPATIAAGGWPLLGNQLLQHLLTRS